MSAVQPDPRLQALRELKRLRSEWEFADDGRKRHPITSEEFERRVLAVIDSLDSQPGVQAVTDAEVERLQEIERRAKSLQTMICEQHQVWPHGPEGLFSFILTGAAVRAEAGKAER